MTRSSGRSRRLAEHIGARNTGCCERFFAISGGRTAHVAFHVSQARASAASANVRTGRANRQVAGSDRSNLRELRGGFPDVDELLLADIAARQRKLHAWIDVAVGRDVAGAMAGAAWDVIHHVYVGA